LGVERPKCKRAAAFVVIEVRNVLVKVGFKDVEKAVSIVVGGRETHPCLLQTVFGVGDSGLHATLGEGSIAIILIKETRGGIARLVDVRPSAVQEVSGQRSDERRVGKVRRE